MDLIDAKEYFDSARLLQCLSPKPDLEQETDWLGSDIPDATAKLSSHLHE